MITKVEGEVRCRYCGKLIVLFLNGELRFHCPRCKRYQVIISYPLDKLAIAVQQSS